MSANLSATKWHNDMQDYGTANSRGMALMSSHDDEQFLLLVCVVVDESIGKHVTYRVCLNNIHLNTFLNRPPIYIDLKIRQV